MYFAFVFLKCLAGYFNDLWQYTPPCDLGTNCTCDGSTCTSTGDVTVTTSVVVSTTTITVTGSLTIDPTGSIAITSGGLVNVTDTTTIVNGTLIIDGVTAPKSIVVITSGMPITGTFDNITIVPDASFPSLMSCETLQAVQSLDASQTTLTVLVSIDSSGCDTGLSEAAIIGIAVGCGVLGLAIIASIIGVCLYRRRHKQEMERTQAKIESVQQGPVTL